MENKVAKKAIVVFDLASCIPAEDRIVGFDLEPFLYKGLVLKEKEFRKELKEHSFDLYKNKLVYLHCSSHAIVPTWAYMLLTAKLNEVGAACYFGKIEDCISLMVLEQINQLNVEPFRDQRVVVKGCGDKCIIGQHYLRFVERIKPVAKVVNYGEACSMVMVSR